jgi:hypothetical protein
MSFTLDSVEVELLKIIAEKLENLCSKVELQNLRLKELIDEKRPKKVSA